MPTLTRKQAVELYNAFVEPFALGSDPDGNVVSRNTPASVLARYNELPYNLLASETLSPKSKPFNDRCEVAEFLRAMADALDAPSASAQPAADQGSNFGRNSGTWMG